MNIRILLLALCFTGLFSCGLDSKNQDSGDDLLLKTGKNPTLVIPVDAEKSASDTTQKESENGH